MQRILKLSIWGWKARALNSTSALSFVPPLPAPVNSSLLLLLYSGVSWWLLLFGNWKETGLGQKGCERDGVVFVS